MKHLVLIFLAVGVVGGILFALATRHIDRILGKKGEPL